MRPPCSCLPRPCGGLLLHQPTPAGVNHSPPPPHHFPTLVHASTFSYTVKMSPRAASFLCVNHTFPRVQRFLLRNQHLLRRVPCRGRKNMDFLSMREYPR
jgi:hypothetical protein